MSSNPLSVDKALSRAKSLARKGDVDHAMQIYRAVLERFPGNKRAMDGVTSLMKLKRNLERDIAGPSPTREQIATLIALHRQGRLREASERGLALVKKYPNVPLILNILGVINADAGHLQDAVAYYSRALKLKPDYAEAHNNLGNALNALGRRGEAIASVTKALQLKPDFAEAHNNLGNLLNEQGEHERAIASLTTAVQLKPGFAQAHYNLGAALKGSGRDDEAVVCLSRAVQLRPDYAEAHNNLGNLLNELGRDQAAIASLREALRLKPDLPEMHCNLGKVLAVQGMFEEAAASFTRALELNPSYAEAHRSLGAIKRCEAGDPRVTCMEGLIGDPAITADEKMHLSFALGKAYEDVGDADVSFRYLVAANRLLKEALCYNIDRDRRLFVRIKSIFAGEAPLEHKESGLARKGKKRPIFIVGMPRSGTTLAEQILASHSQVYGAGELTALNRIVAQLLADLRRADADRLTAGWSEAVRTSYLATLDDLGCREPCITDKMPLNFRWIGFILNAISDAKIIHVRRDPAATCWSIFKHYFASPGNGFANDLVDVAEYYKLYVEMMDFWKERFPGQIYDLVYEAITGNPEPEMRRLLDHCDLPWEDQCLEFHKTERAVRTASSTQVRREIYTGSSEAWRKYETQLQPMLQALHE